MSRWLDALKAKSRISENRDTGPSNKTIPPLNPAGGVVSKESVVSAVSEKQNAVDQSCQHAGGGSHTRGSEINDKGLSIDTTIPAAIDNGRSVNNVRSVSDFKNAEPRRVRPEPDAALHHDWLYDLVGDENYTPPRRVLRNSGLIFMPTEGATCATCGGCAWRVGPGAGYQCDEPTCIDYDPVMAVRRPVPKRFLWPPAFVPDPCGVCMTCGGARWGHSPTVLEAFGFDGWKRWFCLSCHSSRMARGDVQIFVGEGHGDRQRRGLGGR